MAKRKTVDFCGKEAVFPRGQPKPLNGGWLWRQRIGAGGRIWRQGIVNDGPGAFGRFGDKFEVWFERGILAMLGQQAVGVASDNGDDIVQFMRHCGCNVTC